MKKFINWLKNPASDFLLFVIVLVLANLVSNKAFLRFDLTSQKSFSLSPASKQVIRTIEEPLSIKVFFTSNLPAPYNNVEQYVRDILIEYKNASKKNFSYEFYDMEKTENQSMAREYNLHQLQFQEVKNNEVGFKQAWMGLVILYADRIETIDQLDSSDGLEYKLTTKISNMIDMTNSLSGLVGRVKMTLYYSKALDSMNIRGTKEIEESVRTSYMKANEKSLNRIDFSIINPNNEESKEISKQYGLQNIIWNDKNGNRKNAVLGILLEYNEKFSVIPISIRQSLFGYEITGLEEIETSIQDGLKSLVSKVQQIGYITGHGEKELDDAQYGSQVFQSLLSDTYQIKELNLSSDTIPSGLKTVVINGPTQPFADSELYKIDQFLMKGGNLALFLDPFEEEQSQQQYYYSQPSYIPIDSGLNKILNKYGINVETNYVMDKNCYQSTERGIGKSNIYWAPLLQKSGLNQSNPISKNLGYVLFVQSSSIDLSNAKENKDLKTTVLASSSDSSWTQNDAIILNPAVISAPEENKLSAKNLAVLVEGKFTSAFDKEITEDKDNSDNISSSSHIESSIQNGKIFVAGTSLITTATLIDESGTQPVAMFVRNAIDYLNGKEDLCQMRTKGLSGINVLLIKNSSAINFVKIFNQYILVVLVAVCGFIVWDSRNRHKKQIRQTFDPNDSREGDKEVK